MLVMCNAFFLGGHVLFVLHKFYLFFSFFEFVS